MSAALTTLANVKTWVGSETPDDDHLLARLIAQAGRTILAYLQRPALDRQVYRETYDGSGSVRQFLRQWPVQSVASLAVGSTLIGSAAGYGQAGWTLDSGDVAPPGRPQSLTLTGYEFCRGVNNVAVTYAAGYAVPNEPQTVPAAANYSLAVNAPFGPWCADAGVAYANGTALTPVASAPAQGQYSLVGDGVYQFSAADAGQQVLISYSFVPFDVEQACIEIVAERYRYRDRIGQTSKSLGGQETVAYSLKDLPDYTRLALQPYRNVLFV